MERPLPGVTALAILVTLVGGMPSNAAAQVGFGIRGGVNFTSFDDVRLGSVSETFDNRTGFHFGAFADLALPVVGVRVGVNFLRMGALFEGASFLGNGDFDVDYVTVPVDLRLRLPLLYLFVGPEFYYLLSTDAEPDFEDDLKAVVANAGVGVGVQVGPLLGEIRYTFGLSGITDEQFTAGGFSVTTGDVRQANTLRVSAGFLF